MVNSQATTDYLYDGSNRLLQKDETILGKKYTNKYSYDANDNTKTITYPI